ncbi:tryptophan-rich sensory protein [Rubrolithibacter danxiaensis]|uniref:tryptophan-rich sensory protein n=1 Tax=Rubrolithibacter danxiaensis TaxID=3390805 RepID=UPI003BF899A7
MSLKPYAKLTWWQIALISIAASAIGGLVSRRSSKKERKVYNEELEQAPWAPPGWVFAPAWTINNFFVLLGLQRLLLSNISDRKKLMVLQAMIWVIFFSFGYIYIYFNKKSSTLAAIWTISDMALAMSSFIIAYRPDKKLAFCYLPLFMWTTFAGTVAVYQALKNPDPVFKTEALLD